MILEPVVLSLYELAFPVVGPPIWICLNCLDPSSKLFKQLMKFWI